MRARRRTASSTASRCARTCSLSTTCRPRRRTAFSARSSTLRAGTSACTAMATCSHAPPPQRQAAELVNLGDVVAGLNRSAVKPGGGWKGCSKAVQLLPAEPGSFSPGLQSYKSIINMRQQTVNDRSMDRFLCRCASCTNASNHHRCLILRLSNTCLSFGHQQDRRLLPVSLTIEPQLPLSPSTSPPERTRSCKSAPS